MNSPSHVFNLLALIGAGTVIFTLNQNLGLEFWYSVKLAIIAAIAGRVWALYKLGH
ncbi:hypothetical protein [Vibrio sp. 10N.261.46.A3]|uniref:hypothetical protein n=1 Tax=Vibrio sp. 10N.261.46.A3 TaxID=3229658 RepID=UPI00354EF739